MKVVVTGGAGFIGSNLTDELARDHEVTVIDNLSTGRIENLDHIRDRIQFINGSILDLDLLRRAFAGADTVFHQAAIPSEWKRNRLLGYSTSPAGKGRA